MASKTDRSTAGHSDPAAARAAKLREIAAKVRQAPGSLEDGPDLPQRGCIALGRLTVEAYEAGAWQRDGSLIGDGLRLALTSAGRDDPHCLAGETVPKWVLDAWGAGVETLTGNLMPPSGGYRVQVEWAAGILADEIEREADRIEAGEDYDYRVTLAQAAAVVSKSKRTLERWTTDDPDFPMPEVQGAGGARSYWKWSILRLYLEKKTGMTLPDRFPADPLRPDFGNADPWPTATDS